MILRDNTDTNFKLSRQPNGVDIENCGALHFQGFRKKHIWHDLACMNPLYYFICEIENCASNVTYNMTLPTTPDLYNISKTLPVFYCSSTKNYISTSLTIDGKSDCFNSEDETLRQQLRQLPNLGIFRCNNKTEISVSKVCDYVHDCVDMEDERHCRYPPCNAFQFTCSNKQCISNNKHCDGVVDCKDHSDEMKCSICSSKAEQCVPGTCISKSFYCDKYIDCAGCSADEINDQCDLTRPTPTLDHSSHLFTCKNGQQITREHLCLLDFESDGHSLGCRDRSHLDKNLVNCHEVSCPSRQYSRCPQDGYCIPHEFLCNGRCDCSSCEDEDQCTRAAAISCQVSATNHIHYVRMYVYKLYNVQYTCTVHRPICKNQNKNHTS